MSEDLYSTHTIYGYNEDGSYHWIENDSKEFIDVIGRPSLLGQINRLIKTVDNLAEAFLDTGVVYPKNGKAYKPKWADSGGVYWTLLQGDDEMVKRGLPSMFPRIIKDATQKSSNFVTMTREELTDLMMFLVAQTQVSYDEKTDLIGRLRDLEEQANSCETRAEYDIIMSKVNEIDNALYSRVYNKEIE